MEPAPVQVSVIVPVHNGAPFLKRCILETLRVVREMPFDCELIIAEDGSTDGTKHICSALTAENPEIRLLSDDERLGRGRSLHRAFSLAQGTVLVYLDVDMATDFEHLPVLVDHVLKGAPVVTGSRYLEGSETRRHLVRLVLSKVYNRLVRLLFRSEVLDHQCGFKGFDRAAIRALLPEVESGHWFWDTEVLVRAQHRGFEVREMPIAWQDQSTDGSTVDFLRDIPHFLSELVRLKGRLT